MKRVWQLPLPVAIYFGVILCVGVVKAAMIMLFLLPLIAGIWACVIAICGIAYVVKWMRGPSRPSRPGHNSKPIASR
jgi:hypothetical protein